MWVFYILFVGKIPWRRKWQPTPMFLPGKFHGLGSLAGYSPWSRKESDTTERLHLHHVVSFNLNTRSVVFFVLFFNL